LGTQEQFGRGLHEKIPRSPVGLLRIAWRYDGRDNTRKTAKKVEQGLEIGTD
jgi:hypothetical protein